MQTQNEQTTGVMLDRDELVAYLVELIGRAELRLTESRKDFERARGKSQSYDLMDALLDMHGFQKQRDVLIRAWEMGTGEKWLSA